MNERSNCLQNCKAYDYTSHKGCYRGICKHQRICRGKILECQYVASDMTVCEAVSALAKIHQGSLTVRVCFRTNAVAGATTIQNTTMTVCSGGTWAVTEEQLESRAGGGGYSGTAHTASVCAMMMDHNQIVTGV